MNLGRYNGLNMLAMCWPPWRGKRKAIVIYSPGHLGDILHGIPMLKALRAGKPKTKIIWLVGPWSEALARRYSKYVDEILVFGPNSPSYTRGKPQWQQGAWHQWRMAMTLRREGVKILLAPADTVGRFLANAICPEQWVGIGEWRPPRVRTEVKTDFQAYEKDRYEADAWAGALHPLGIEAKVEHLEYAVTADERQAATNFLKAEGVNSSRSLALVAPGSGWSGKNWLPERFAAVADWLSSEKGFQIAWVGVAGERNLVPESRSADFNWAGRTSLPLLVALMEHAKLFVGNDGGLLHFAAALDVPTVSVWGPTSPEKWAPKGGIHRHIRNVDRCEGCIYWDYRESCLHDHVCMKAISVEEVQVAIDSLLEVKNGSS